ncbi:MAG: hypothetical protein A3H31_01805 [Gallionellales bacterium RIFCSPLOWO2_02_FULL_57_47]|nr:MAG: hypothetical protein A3H31_01805 [Gallionellales bacterium RIFCSPLOWO2_02_FULL_57_47]OGT10736.1 MAG: hypothetical protein A3J49_09925 [Gallionellales bacterium RIFCSPHIGHO2_02_FULL_57_16]
MPIPPPPLRLLLFILVLAFFIGVVQVGLISIAFEKLGLSAESAYLLLMVTLAGSILNLPLFSLKTDSAPPPKIPPELARWMFIKLPPFTGKIIVFINVGGAVVPVAFSLYLMAHNPLNLFHIATAVAVVAIVARTFSFPIPGIGIGIPMLVAPLAAALIATVLDPQQRAPLAYIGGTLGVLIGADLIRLKDIRKLGAPFASIGGAGTFDGVFLTGLVAVLLA